MKQIYSNRSQLPPAHFLRLVVFFVSFFALDVKYFLNLTSIKKMNIQKQFPVQETLNSTEFFAIIFCQLCMIHFGRTVNIKLVEGGRVLVDDGCRMYNLYPRDNRHSDLAFDENESDFVKLNEQEVEFDKQRIASAAAGCMIDYGIVSMQFTPFHFYSFMYSVEIIDSRTHYSYEKRLKALARHLFSNDVWTISHIISKADITKIPAFIKKMKSKGEPCYLVFAGSSRLQIIAANRRKSNDLTLLSHGVMERTIQVYNCEPVEVTRNNADLIDNCSVSQVALSVLAHLTGEVL